MLTLFVPDSNQIDYLLQTNQAAKKKPAQQTLMVSTSPLVLLTGDAVVEDNVIIEQEAAVDATPVQVSQPLHSTPVAPTRTRKQELTTVTQDFDDEDLQKEAGDDGEPSSGSTVTGRPTRAAAKASAPAVTASTSEASGEDEMAEEGVEEKESSDDSKGVKRTRSGRAVTRTSKEESNAAGGDESPTRKSARTTKK